MQSVGNNIRSSGEYDKSDEFPGKEITLAKRINHIVKMINRNEELLNPGNERTRICIDALRNSLEIQYFRDRYRAFYSFAINTEDEFRQNRLGMNRKELLSLDSIEYPGNSNVFFHQNVSACLEISDVYLYNPNVLNHKYYELTEQILKYIALILQPGLIAPTHLERCMQLAFNAKYNSGCLSRQVGAVVTGDDFSVRSVGWNDVPKGQIPCNLRCVEDYCRNKDVETFSEFELEDEFFDEAMKNMNELLQQDEVKEKKAGKCYSYCFKDIYNGITGKSNQVYTRALHAE
jgi:dCMP deaminase